MSFFYDLLLWTIEKKNTTQFFVTNLWVVVIRLIIYLYLIQKKYILNSFEYYINRNFACRIASINENNNKKQQKCLCDVKIRTAGAFEFWYFCGCSFFLFYNFPDQHFPFELLQQRNKQNIYLKKNK